MYIGSSLISRLTYMCYVVPIFIILLVIFVKFGCQCLLCAVFVSENICMHCLTITLFFSFLKSHSS